MGVQFRPFNELALIIYQIYTKPLPEGLSKMFEHKVTDLSYLHKIFKGDVLLVKEMIVLFLRDTPQSLSDIRSSIKQENWSEVAAAAHKLKPNLAYMGLASARLLILDLEKNAKKLKEKDQALSQVHSIEQICRQAYKELKAELEELE